VPTDRIPWSSRRRVQRRRSSADLLASGIRAVLEAPGRRPAHCLHEAEATGHHADRVQRRAGARSAWAWRDPARCQPL